MVNRLLDLSEWQELLVIALCNVNHELLGTFWEFPREESWKKNKKMTISVLAGESRNKLIFNIQSSDLDQIVSKYQQNSKGLFSHAKQYRRIVPPGTRQTDCFIWVPSQLPLFPVKHYQKINDRVRNLYIEISGTARLMGRN